MVLLLLLYHSLFRHIKELINALNVFHLRWCRAPFSIMNKIYREHIVETHLRRQFGEFGVRQTLRNDHQSNRDAGDEVAL